MRFKFNSGSYTIHRNVVAMDISRDVGTGNNCMCDSTHTFIPGNIDLKTYQQEYPVYEESAYYVPIIVSTAVFIIMTVLGTAFRVRSANMSFILNGKG